MNELFSFWKDNKEDNIIDSSSLEVPQEDESEERDLGKSICFFCVSGSARRASQPEPEMAERPLVMQSYILAAETWQGKVISIDGEAITIDVRNSRQTTIRRILRARKEIVKGDVASAFIGMSATVLYNKKRVIKWEGKSIETIEETTEIRLRQPSHIPEEARRKEIEDKMKRYSYMFRDEV